MNFCHKRCGEGCSHTAGTGFFLEVVLVMAILLCDEAADVDSKKLYWQVRELPSFPKLYRLGEVAFNIC